MAIEKTFPFGTVTIMIDVGLPPVHQFCDLPIDVIKYVEQNTSDIATAVVYIRRTNEQVKAEFDMATAEQLLAAMVAEAGTTLFNGIRKPLFSNDHQMNGILHLINKMTRYDASGKQSQNPSYDVGTINRSNNSWFIGLNLPYGFQFNASSMEVNRGIHVVCTGKCRFGNSTGYYTVSHQDGFGNYGASNDRRNLFSEMITPAMIHEHVNDVIQELNDGVTDAPVLFPYMSPPDQVD